MPLKIDKLIATEVFVDGNEITGKEGLLTNIWIPLSFSYEESGGFSVLEGSEENLFYGTGLVYISPEINGFNGYTFYEDNNGLIHFGVTTVVIP